MMEFVLAVSVLAAGFVTGHAQEAQDSRGEKLRSDYLASLDKDESSQEDRIQSADKLYWLFRLDQAASFDLIVAALDHHWAAVRRVASADAGYYYVDEVVFSGDVDWASRSWPDTVTNSRAIVLKTLRANAEEGCWDVAVPAIGSLARMDELEAHNIARLCEVLSGDKLNRNRVCDYRTEDAYYNLRKEAFRLLSRLLEREEFRASVLYCFESIKDSHSGILDPMIPAIKDVLDENRPAEDPE
jgi:hypothetical protein